MMSTREFDLEAFQTVVLDNLLLVSQNLQTYFDENIGDIIMSQFDTLSPDVQTLILKKGLLTNKKALLYCLEHLDNEASWVTVRNYSHEDFSGLIIGKALELVGEY